MTEIRQVKELARLRNRHVAKLLSFVGEQPPYLETAIKKEFSMFADDVQANIINSDNRSHNVENSERSGNQ